MDICFTYDCQIAEVVSSCIFKLSQINQISKYFAETISFLVSTSMYKHKDMLLRLVEQFGQLKILYKLQSVQNFACRIVTS